MPRYHYTALSETGKITTDVRVAGSPDELRQMLAAQGLRAQSIRAALPGITTWRQHRVRPEEFLLFNQEFLALSRAGLTIPDALKLTANRLDSPYLGQTLTLVLEDVRGGALLSEACARHPHIFEALYISAVKTGEKTGDLANVLARYQEFLKHRVAMRKKLAHALAYPMFLFVTLVVILGLLFAFVMPRFIAMYADFGARLPLATRLLIGIVENLPVLAPAIAMLGAGCWYGWRKLISTGEGRLRVDRWRERLPVIGDVTRTIAVAHSTRSLSTLLSGGTPLVEALRTLRVSLTSEAYAMRLDQVTTQVIGGGSFAHAAQAADLFPPTAIKMIEVGEASGSLDRMLAEVAEFYEELLDNRLGRMMTLIEPILMLLMGVLIGGIIVVMYLPIFNLAEIIK